ncbi:MAG: response regulator, partial [Chloroflexi bacterium]|nr:response regulator [Chloroflexota bacterium]
MKVLIIDDEPDVIEVVDLCFSLRWPEADIASATTADEGLRLVGEEKPEIIGSDIMLPDSDGFQLGREMR